jgi:hypothetical protein
MENSFLYSKSISFLTGRTCSTRPDPYHESALPALSLSLCATTWWAPRAIAAHRSASTSLCDRAHASGKKYPIPHTRALFRPPAAGTDSSPHATPRTSGRVTSGRPTPPSLPDCRGSSLRANPRSMGHLPPASSRHRRPAATTSLRVHAMQRLPLPLPLDANHLKPGASHQATSRAHQVALSSPQQASAAACPNALSRVHVRWRRPSLRLMPRAAASTRSSTSGKSTVLRALHTQLALPLLASTPALLRTRMRSPPSLRSPAWLRSAAPSAGKCHADTEPSHPWHHERRYKRTPPTSCPHYTPPTVFL